MKKLTLKKKTLTIVPVFEFYKSQINFQITHVTKQ